MAKTESPLLFFFFNIDYILCAVHYILVSYLFVYLFILYIYLFNLFIFGCVGSLLLLVGFSPVAASGAHSSLRCTGLSLRWPLFVAEHRL